MHGILNQELYSVLQRWCGPVKIMNPGKACRLRVEHELGSPWPRNVVEVPGESYMVCCPACGDTRFRLSFSYMWNTPDSEGRPLRHLVHCFNESCEKDFLDVWTANLRQYCLRADQGVVDLRTGEDYDDTANKYVSPGQVTPLHLLPEDHHAIRYLRGRGFDIAELSRLYDVGYCVQGHNLLVTGRIIFPIYEQAGDPPIGWQARFLSWDGDGTIPNKFVAKWLTMPGMPRRSTLYGLDKARGKDFVIVCEGPLDVIACGPPAVGLLGKSMTDLQLRKLKATWGDQLVVVMLDEDARDDTVTMAEQLRQYFRLVLPVFLPAGKDPGSMTRPQIWQAIDVAAEAMQKSGTRREQPSSLAALCG